MFMFIRRAPNSESGSTRLALRFFNNFTPHLHTGLMFKFEDLAAESSLLNSPRYVYGDSPPQPPEYLISTYSHRKPRQ